jgi:hypothetical protein
VEEPTQKDLFEMKESLLTTMRAGSVDSVVVWWGVRVLEAPSEAIELTILRDLWYWNREAMRLRKSIHSQFLALEGHYRKLNADFEIGPHQLWHVAKEG